MLAQKCPMLEYLTIRSPEHVTDAGLRALAPYSNLRFLSIDYNYHHRYNYNSSVSLSVIDQFLSATGRKREMPVYWYRPECDNSETLVYRFIESLTVDNFTITTEHQHSIVTKFPNLRHFCINQGASFLEFSDFHVLSGLDKLSSLELEFDCSDEMWLALVPLFRRIGANMKKLTIPFPVCYFDKDKFNLMYELCPNVEYLDVSTHCEHSTLVVLQLKNLAYLKCFNWNPRRDGVLQFGMDDGVMVKLEKLVVIGFDMDRQIVEMMLDHRSFPNLKQITIGQGEKPTGRIDRFRRIAEMNNLDLEFDFLTDERE